MKVSTIFATVKLYDCVFIGSGPISVIESCLMDNSGQDVLMIDDKDQIGGAWVAIDVGDFGRLEIGCHIWSYSKETYHFLQEYFELDLVKLNPQPFFLKDNLKISYDHKHALMTGKNVIKFSLKFQFKSLKNYVKNPSVRFPIIPKPYLYPRGGAREFQSALQEKIENSNIELSLKSKVNELEKVEDHWVLRTEEGEELRTKQIKITSTSSLKSIKCKDQYLELEHRELFYTHFHLVLKGKLNQPCSYIRVLNHEFIHRISDITYQLSGDNKDVVSVILVGVFEDKVGNVKNEATIVDRVMDYLMKQKFINTSNELLYSQKNKFSTLYIADDDKRTINALDDQLELLHTTDLIYGVRDRLPKWKSKS